MLRRKVKQELWKGSYNVDGVTREELPVISFTENESASHAAI